MSCKLCCMLLYVWRWWVVVAACAGIAIPRNRCDSDLAAALSAGMQSAQPFKVVGVKFCMCIGSNIYIYIYI